MRHRPTPCPPDARPAEIEMITMAYRRAHRGDDRAALLAVIADALADLDTAERQIEAQARQVSAGYARSAVARR